MAYLDNSDILSWKRLIQNLQNKTDEGVKQYNKAQNRAQLRNIQEGGVHKLRVDQQTHITAEHHDVVVSSNDMGIIVDIYDKKSDNIDTNTYWNDDVMEGKERVTEGTWSIPETPEQVEKLTNLLKNPLDAETALDELYDVFGDDELFDDLEVMKRDEPETDVRHVVIRRLKDMNFIKEVRENASLNEAFFLAPWILPALATAVRVGAPALKLLLKGGKKAAPKVKDTATNMIQKSTASGVIVGAVGKTVYDKAGDAIDGIKKIFGIDMDEDTLSIFAQIVVKYGIPIGAIAAVLYGGKQLKDYMAGEEEKQTGNTTINNYYNGEPATENLEKVEEDEDEEDGVSAEDLVDIIMHRIKQNKELMLALLGDEGPDPLMNAVEDVAGFYSGTTEVGSSDVSAMVDAVIRTMYPLDYRHFYSEPYGVDKEKAQRKGMNELEDDGTPEYGDTDEDLAKALGMTEKELFELAEDVGVDQYGGLTKDNYEDVMQHIIDNFEDYKQTHVFSKAG